MNMFGTYGGYGGGFGGGFGGGGFGGGLDGRFSAAPSAYDEYYKAYSMAMLPGRERANVSYGGKIIMPPSALARLTHLEIESPWLFSISNAGVSTADYKSTHAGVLEFIAEEGCVHLPAWMMRTLNLAEGDPIHLKGTTLPQGKFVKIQPQTVDFLEISDPKAVLEQAMRNFSCLTKGDIIEFSYNCLTFEIEVLEVKPDAEGIAIIETDLEVDFAAPKGYVEPAPVPRPPPPTMADKLKIDQNKVDSMPASGTSTPRSVESASAAGAASGASSVFKGQGATLSGKKARKSQADKPIEALDKFSMIRRTDVPRIVTNDTQLEDKKVPAALRLPFGQLYFGYDVVPLDAEDGEKAEQTTTISFSGGGQTLSGRAPRRKKEDEGAEKKENKDGGRTLGGKPANKDVIAIDDSD